MSEILGILFVKSAELWAKDREALGSEFMTLFKEKVSLSEENFSQLTAEVIEAFNR